MADAPGIFNQQRLAGRWARDQRLRRGALRWTFTGILLVLIVYPLAMIVVASFRSSPPGTAGSYEVQSWVEVLTSTGTWTVVWTTIKVAVPRVLIGMALATFFAWAIVRTDLPMKKFFEPALMLMFFLPNLPIIIAWTLLGSPRSGLLNTWTTSLLGFDLGINVYSYGWLVFLTGAYTAPILYIFLAPVFRNMDVRLEEASATSGAGRIRTLMTIVVPLMKPGILGAMVWAFVLALESFEFEQLIGVPAGIFVLSTKVYNAIGDTNPNFAVAAVFGVILMILTLSVVVLQRALLHRQSFETISGKEFKSSKTSLGKWRWIVFAALNGYLLVFAVVPIFVLIASTFTAVRGFFSLDLLTFDHWVDTLTTPSVQEMLMRTVVLGVVVATTGTVLSFFTNYLVSRTTWRGRGVVDLVSWLPLAVPSIVLALAFVWGYVRTPLYGTLWILVIALTVRALPTASRFLSPTMQQIGKDLEYVSHVSGAGPTRTFSRILVPLLRPALVSGWLFVFVFSIRILEIPLLLSGPGNEVIAMSIFRNTANGSAGVASVLAVLQVMLCVLAYITIGLATWRATKGSTASIEHTQKVG